MDIDLKRSAARQALAYVQNGMVIGLGTGSTTAYFIDFLSASLQSGVLQNIRGVPTSEASAKHAYAVGIPLMTLSDCIELDLAVDGADEVDPNLDLIKGLGRALMREKIVEVHAKRFVVIVDESKLVPYLGHHSPLPVEILPFEAAAHVRWLNSLGCRAELWLEESGEPVVTDNGNFLARCWFSGGIPDPHQLSRQLADRPGILEHGLFLDMASEVIVASSDGVKILERRR